MYGKSLNTLRLLVCVFFFTIVKYIHVYPKISIIWIHVPEDKKGVGFADLRPLTRHK